MINVTIDRSGDGAPTVNVSCPGIEGERFDGSYEAWQCEDSDLSGPAIAYIHDVAEELEEVLRCENVARIRRGCKADWNTLRSHDPASEDCEEDVTF